MRSQESAKGAAGELICSGRPSWRGRPPSSISSTQMVTITAISTADTTKSASATVTLNPPSTFVPIRVNAGGPAYTDSLGHLRSADFGFTAGSSPHAKPGQQYDSVARS
jgi:hypothetical protein